MASAIGSERNNDEAVDFSALDEELFGDMSDDKNDDHHQRRLHNYDSSTRNTDSSQGFYHGVTPSETLDTVAQNTPQIMAVSPSHHYTPPQSHPTTPVSSSENLQHMAHAGPPDSLSSGPGTIPHAISENTSLSIGENISWIKNRITDVHQLLLHYLSLRDAHQVLARDLQKETILRTETQEALDSIREQQDQTSEDFPKLQFQIAQLKLDFQNERAARVAAETDLAKNNAKMKAYAAGCVLMQTQVSNYKAKETIWLKEKAELSLLVNSMVERGRRSQSQNLPRQEVPTEPGHQDVREISSIQAEQLDPPQGTDKASERPNKGLDELVLLDPNRNDARVNSSD